MRVSKRMVKQLQLCDSNSLLLMYFLTFQRISYIINLLLIYDAFFSVGSVAESRCRPTSCAALDLSHARKSDICKRVQCAKTGNHAA